MSLQVQWLIAPVLACLLCGVGSASCGFDNKELDKHFAELGFVIDNSTTMLSKPASNPKFDLADRLDVGSGSISIVLIVAPDGSVADQVVLCAEPSGVFEVPMIEFGRTLKYSPLPENGPQGYRWEGIKIEREVRTEVIR